MRSMNLAIILCLFAGSALAQAADVKLCASTRNLLLAHALRALTKRNSGPKRSGSDSGKRRNVRGKWLK